MTAHWTAQGAVILALLAVLVAIISPYGLPASNSVPIAPRGLQLPCSSLHHSTEIGFMDSVVHSSALHLVIFATPSQLPTATLLASALACTLHSHHIRVHTAPRLMWDARGRDHRPWGTYYGIDPIANVQLFFGAPQRRFSCGKWFRSRTTIHIDEFTTPLHQQHHDMLVKWVADTVDVVEADTLTITSGVSPLPMLSTPDYRYTRVIWIHDQPLSSSSSMMATLRGLSCEWRELHWNVAIITNDDDINTIWQRLSGDGHTWHPSQYPLLVVIPLEEDHSSNEVSKLHVLELAREHGDIESFLFACNITHSL
jgi:hypothetical protein